jgi:hypothetical protein
MNCWQLRLVFVLGLLTLAAAARADIPVPEPQTVWARNAQPSGQSIAYAGVCLSAAIVAAGLIVARWPARGSRMGLIATGIVSAVAVLVVAAGAAAAIQQANRDRGAWKQWETDESNRRSSWRGPPIDFPETPPPSPNAESTTAEPPGPE